MAKYAHASAAEVEIAVGDGALRVDVRDDGRSGAEIGRESGLLGLKDRVEVLGGWISLRSEAGRAPSCRGRATAGSSQKG